MGTPGEVTASADQIAVADSGRHRVLIWNQFPSTNFARADMVIGQTSFTANGGGTSARQLFFPFGAYFAKDKLIVADMRNNRVLVFTSR